MIQRIIVMSLTVLCCVVAQMLPGRTANSATTTTITTGPAMTTPRAGHWLLRDTDGNLFALGGYDASGAALSSADIYTKADNTFAAVSLSEPRLFSTCAKLADGNYLLAGGATALSMRTRQSTAEIFNPTTRTSVATASSMTMSRANATAATLTGGKVLIVGGSGDETAADSAEVYDPTSQTFTATGALNTARSAPLVLPASDGTAVVIGGFSAYGGPTPESVELYDPATNAFTVLRDTLFPDESGWITALSPGLGWGNQPVSAQRDADGKYLFLANKNTGIFTDYVVFSFDPATKAIEKLDLSPALPTRNPVDFRTNTTPLPHPLLPPTGNVAYVMAETFDSFYADSYAYSASSTASSQIMYYEINLASNAVTQSAVRALPTGQYVAMAAKIQADASQFCITGGAPYGYGKYAGGRPYGGYGYQHYNVDGAYAQATSLFDAIDWHIFKGLTSIFLLLQD